MKNKQKKLIFIKKTNQKTAPQTGTLTELNFKVMYPYIKI